MRVDADRDIASRATAAPEPGFELSRQQRLAESLRFLFGTVAFFAFLIAVPLVALFLGVFATLFSGIV